MPEFLMNISDAAESRWGLRKILTQSEEVVSEAGVPVEGIKRISAIAVVKNPFIGSPSNSDLQNPVQEIAPLLATELTKRILSSAGGAGNITSFGKGAIIGLDGELEHGAAMIHTPYYASLLRGYFEGDTVIPFSDLRADAGTELVIPLGRKEAGPTRDYFQNHTVYASDAPRADEIVIAVAVSTGTRPFPRSGDRTTDPKFDINEIIRKFS